MSNNQPIINENTNQNEEASSISLLDIWYLIKKNIIFIGICVFAGVLIGFVYSNFIRKPVYTASSTILVQAESTGISSSEYQQYQYSTYLVNTMSDFIISDLVMDQVAKQILLSENKITQAKIDDATLLTDEDKVLIAAKVKEVKANTSVKSSTDSLIVTVSYSASLGKNEDSNQVIEICNLIVAATEDVSNTLKEDSSDYKFKIFANKIVKMVSATVATKSTSLLKFVAIGFAIGLVISCAVIFIKYITDDTFKTKEDLENATGVHVLTFIEGLSRKDNK